MSNDRGGVGRASRIRDTPSDPRSTLARFNEGQFIRCPKCSILTTMQDMVDGCPNCRFNPVTAGKRRQLAAAGDAINIMGAPGVMQLNDRQYARLLGKLGGRRVA